MTPPCIDIRIVQLLISRMCHDLAGPIGAVNNGVELATDLSGPIDSEVLELIGQSARQATVDLEFMRLAFGFGGGSAGTYVADAERLCRSVIANDRIKVVWHRDIGSSDVNKDAAKLLVNLVIVGRQALRGRGTVDVFLTALSDAFEIEVIADGPGAGLDPEYRKALGGFANLPAMTPATSQGLFAFGLARLAGGNITVDESGPERVVLSATASRLS